MMMKSIAIVSLLAASTAHAEPLAEPTRYLQGSVLVGGSAPVVGPNALLAVDGGYRLGTSPVWVHAVAAYGPADDDQGTGDNQYIRAGLEARACGAGGFGCVMAGLDVGGQRGTWQSAETDRTESVSAVVVVPRIGIEAGGDHVRVRLGLELAEAIVRNNVVRTGGAEMATTSSGATGAELGLGVAYQW